MRSLALSFHGVGVPPLGTEQSEWPYWISRDALSIFLKDAKIATSASNIALLATFDDGNRSDLEIAAPLLKEQKLQGAFFPCIGRFSSPTYLSQADLREISSMGFEIGSHGIDHVHWTTLDDNNLKRETQESKKQLEDVLGTEIKSVAIPFGDYNRRVLLAIKRAGYEIVYSSDRGFISHRCQVRMRWTFHTHEAAEIQQILLTANSISHVLITGLKKSIKSWR